MCSKRMVKYIKKVNGGKYIYYTNSKEKACR